MTRLPTRRGPAGLPQAPPEAASRRGRHVSWELPVGRCSCARLTPPAALVAVALDLDRELLGAEVDRVDHVPRAVAGAECHPLEVKGRLRDLRFGDRWVALLEQLDLELGELRYLLGDLPESLDDVLPRVIRDGQIPALDLDPHRP